MLSNERGNIMKEKWLLSTEIFDEYERRFAKARAEKEFSHPWEPKTRERIMDDAKRMLRYDEALVPAINNMEPVSRTAFDTYDAIQYRYTTWEHFYGAASLYMPRTDEKVPLVFVCCGHGEEGRLTESYMAMGHRLASLGMAAIVIDNIGQGDRNLSKGEFKAPDHWNAIAPFYCGLTLQGMIVMETIALIRYMKNDPRFDADRFGACGNSGGGTLTMFLAALAPELSVLCSSGYPAEVTYVLQKERRHCACNLLIGQAHSVEMWEMYSVFAPKPMLLEGGKMDNLLPLDLAHRNARKVRNTYVQLGANENFEFDLTDTAHSWGLADLNYISRFLSQRLLGVTPEDMTESHKAGDLEPYRVEMPADMLSTAALSTALTGITMPEGTELEDIFVPTYKGEKIDPSKIQNDVGRGDIMRVFAQFECDLSK